MYDDPQLSLVFRRLAIVDISHGRQPIWNEDNTVMVVVNGEIYNYRELRTLLGRRHHFRTESDSEVFLHLFEERGVEALREIRGMFAIALHESSREYCCPGRGR
jgi:asparagine synthase (glutamine-hydrolysing)